MVKAIVGANWGDEGKGKITDYFAESSDVVIRFQGGANAGHTIINNYGRFALHTLPSGVFNQKVINVVGNGVALDIRRFCAELKALEEGGVPEPKIIITPRTQVVMPYHVLFDQYEEERLGGKAFGSTKSGIAPFYSDKYAKIGFQVCELFNDEILKTRLEKVCELKNCLLEHLYHKPLLDPKALYNEMVEQREMIDKYVNGEAEAMIQYAVAADQKILLEGQLGTLKDIDFGIYPFTTSSNTIAGYGTVGAGIPATKIDEVIAVTKAYSSCVGGGRFLTELLGDEGEELRRRGGDKGEYGATTGRPRRVGWFDCVATAYGCAMQGATGVALTAIDVLSYLDEIPVCIAYDIDGEARNQFPVTPVLNRAEPIFTTMPGWKTDIRGCTSFKELPANARAYVSFVESAIGVPVKYVSTGPRREDMIVR